MQFVDAVPDAITGGGRTWGHLSAAQELMKRPNAWALVQSYNTRASACMAGRKFRLHDEAFEWTTRKNDAGKTDLYARFVAR